MMLFLCFFVIPLVLCGPLLILDALNNWVSPWD
jgi:hypothetical protein